MIEIYLLEQLDAVARYKTLSRAAEELCITQPALSRSMKKLESELGVTLFDRDKGRITLNQTGLLAADLARRVLDDDRDLVGRVRALDRSLRSVALGSCAPWPILALARPMQRTFSNMTVSSEIRDSDDVLIRGLKDRTYQIVALHEIPDDNELWCQYLDSEAMTLSVKLDHPLAGRTSVTFEDFGGESILAWGNVSFWNKLVREKCPASTTVLFQADLDALEELVTKTDFPTFSSDRMADAGYREIDRVDIPIDDPDLRANYYVACLDSEKERYAAFFNSVRAQAIAP